MPGHSTPLALRRLAPGAAQAGRSLGAGRVWRAAGGVWDRFELHWQEPVPPARWRLRARAGVLGLADLTLLQLGAGIALAPDWPPGALDDAARLACAGMDPALAEALGGPLQWEPPDPVPDAGQAKDGDGPPLCLRLLLLPAQGEARHALTVCIPAQALAELLRDERWEALPSPPQPPWLDDVPCEALACVCAVRVPAAQWRALACGDLVVLCDAARGLGQLCALRIGRVAVEFENLQDQPFGVLACRSWKDVKTLPEAVRDPMSELAQDEDFPVDDVDVTLEVVAGRTRLSVGALRALRPGAVLQLSHPASAQVELVAGGLRVGVGELVQVDGWLAVEVRHLGRAP